MTETIPVPVPEAFETMVPVARVVMMVPEPEVLESMVPVTQVVMTVPVAPDAVPVA